MSRGSNDAVERNHIMKKECCDDMMLLNAIVMMNIITHIDDVERYYHDVRSC